MKSDPTCFLLAVFLLAIVNGVADTTSGLIAHFPLLDGTGDIASEQAEGNDGSLQNSPAWIDSGLRFDGINQYVSAPAATGNGITNRITLSAWIKPESFGEWEGIVTKGTEKAPYTFGVWSDGRLVMAANVFDPPGGSPWETINSEGTVPLNVWTHVAVTYDGSKIRFYINGTLDIAEDHTITFGTINEALTIGGDLPGGDEHFHGAIRDARVYNRALTDSDLAKLGTQTLGTSFEGLWVGEARLNEVKEVATGSWGAAPGFSEQILLHVDDDGVGRVVHEAILMKTRANPSEMVVVTDPSHISDYDGVTMRGGQWVGQRFSSATMPLPSPTITLSQIGESLSASFSLAASHPLNPFRHKYHPDLSTGTAVSRVIQIQWNVGSSPSDNRLDGTLWESVSGIHKDTIEARGPVTFTRVSTSGQLR